MAEKDSKTVASGDTRSTDQRIADLEAQLAAQRAATGLGTTPWHGAGIEDEIAETWSQHDQELAHRGEHPDQR